MRKCIDCNKQLKGRTAIRCKKHSAIERSKTMPPPNRKGKQKHLIGSRNYLWAGDKVSYSALHMWVRRWLKKTGICTNCGQKKQTDWANISKKYLRDLNDYKELCKSCHSKYDNIPEKVWKERRSYA